MFLVFYALKKILSDVVLNFEYFIVTLPSDFFAGFIALLVRYPIKGVTQDILETLEQDILLKNSDGSGEGTGGSSGSGVGSGTGGPSGSGEPSGSGGPSGSDEPVISYHNYYETDSEAGGNSPIPLPSDDGFRDSNIDKIIYGNESFIESSTKEELKDAIKTIEMMKEMHREMQAPASNSEIERLTKKAELCQEELEKKSSQGEKESSIKDGEDKGKGKGKEKSN
jgi:hypothetical protein